VIRLYAIVLDTPEYDIIIGKLDIIKYSLIQKLWYAWANITRPSIAITPPVRPLLDTSHGPAGVMATIGHADEINSAVPIDGPPSYMRLATCA
jgi:hypothetical protein